METIRVILSLSREEGKSQNPVHRKTNMTTLYFKKSMARSPLCLRLFLAALACFAIPDRAHAVSPPPDGGYGPPAYGVGNTAEGEDPLSSLTSGAFNTATGFRSLGSVTTGNFNTAIGAGALFKRFKNAIKPMDRASEAVLALKPVSFHYKSDNTNTPQFGLIAEEVAAVNPDLVVRDENGEIYSVRYDAVNAMLLNEFLKEHRKNNEQEATIAQLKRHSAEQRHQIETLTAGLQKVSDQLELSQPAPRTVVNDQ